jgi:hypothetical protein
MSLRRLRPDGTIGEPRSRLGAHHRLHGSSLPIPPSRYRHPVPLPVGTAQRLPPFCRRGASKEPSRKIRAPEPKREPALALSGLETGEERTGRCLLRASVQLYWAALRAGRVTLPEAA